MHYLARTSVVACFAVALAALGSACGSSDDGKTAGPSVGGSGAQGGTGVGGGGGSAASSGSGNGGSGAGINFDGGAGDGSTATGCEKIDFLFIVDNSVSMQDNQKALVAAFPNFISAIESTVNAGSNYHIMVTDTDEWGRCNTANPWTGMNPTSTTCNAYIKNTKFDECDRTMGAGVVNPAGEYASNKVCAFPAGRRYLQQNDPNLSDTFACAAQVGTAGHPSERPMDSLVATLQPAINAAGGCNEGFLRDDALLVITFISDDPNYEDQGTAQDWYNAVVAAKKGDPDAVAVVGLIPGDAGCGNASGGKINGAHWAEFIGKFTYSLKGSVCSADYGTTFSQAVKVIDESCDAYVPPIQ